ncbi:DNRLRE domain-containing protein [Sorangium sp. So ce429]
MKVFKAACIGVASTFVAGCGADTGGASGDGAREVDRAAQALPTDEQVCITIQRDAGPAGVADAVLWQNAPRWNDGASPTLSTGTSAAGGNRRSLLRFDLSGVPSGASVVSANLSVSQLYKTIDSTVHVHRVTSAWEESAVTWSSLGEAFDPAIAASFTTGGGSGFRSSDITELARAWVSGEAENHGVLLEEDPVQRTEYHSSEKAQLDKRPKLDLCYVTCEDGIQNGDETDVDCGGASCAPCDTCAPVLFGDDFSDDAQGWTLGPEWQIGPAAASSGGAHGSDPAVDHTSSDDNGVAGVVLGGNASTALHGLYYLESPPFDTSSATGDVALSFYRWLNSDYAPFMHNTVEVFDGASWVTLWASGDSPGINDTSWTLVTHDLTPYRSATTRVRFGFDVTNSGAYTIGSWNIDDVYVTQTCGDPAPSDAFPLDPAASVDTDGDGYPDAWDPGQTQADSTTGLVLDAFPLDSVCQLPEHGLASDPSVCDIANGIPDYVPDQVMLGSDDVVYLFSQAHDRIFRWSLATDYHLNPIVLGASDALHAAYGADDHRLYVAYQSGALTQIDLAAGVAEAPFATLPAQPHGLATAGSIVMAADPSGAWGTHYTFLPSGAGVSTVDWNYYSREYAWSPSTGRMYFFRDDTSPNDLHWESIDTTSGAITGEGESPYHGDFAIAPPIRPSVDGGYVLLGSGDLYDGATLEVVASLPIAPSDAAWLPDGTLITLRADAGGTLLEQWAKRGPIFVVANVQRFSGEPVRVLSRPDAVVVITSEGARPVFSEYTPTDDGDGDGVPFTEDAFPTDSAASVDTDGDGYPDAWNPGQTQADSATGLVLDAFPLDSACQLPEHGLASDPGVCDIANGIPDYVPDQVMFGSDDVVYLFSQAHDRIFRWSLSADYHLNPIVLGASDALHAAYGAEDHRLYVAYESGALTQIDLAAGVAEAPFATLPAQPHGLATAGSIVMAADPSGAWGTHYTFLPSGAGVSTADWNYHSREYAWSPSAGRMYFFRDNMSPNDLHWESIDTTSGAITGEGESPYHGDFAIAPPIRPSVDGGYVLLGSGDLYDGATLEVVASLPITPSDAAWLPDGTLITLRADAGDTLLEQWAESGETFLLVNHERFSGEPIRVLSRSTTAVVITDMGSQPTFAEYVPTDDGDGDGVPFADDAFPLDAAASVDTDGDGHPDAWNPGQTQADSATGLVLDAFPLDSACQLPEHGLASDPGVCDIANGIPDYVPDQVMLGSDDVVYLFSRTHDRIFRWSLSADYHLNPIVLGASDALHAAYGAEDHRLYVAYESGALTQIDLAAGVAEAPFATLPAQPHGLATAGSIVMAADPSGAWGTHYTFLPSGTRVSAIDWNYQSPEYAWSAALGRMFYFSHWSPADLHWESIDTTSGAITGTGESPYHGDFAIVPPIRPSVDGSYVLLGSGDLYDGTTLDVVGSLPIAPSDAAWLPDGTLITLRADAGGTLLEQWAKRGQIFVVANVQRFSGEPVRVMSRPDAVVVITSEGARPVFSEYTPTDDGDGDGVPFTEDAFPTDSAASVDTDGDGYPDAWNPGQTQADSTTGLVLDAFPLDSACQLPEHGLASDSGVCDIANGIPDYVPDQVMLGSDDVVYLFSRTHDRIFRWSLSADYHLNPIVLGASDALHAAYGAEDHRLYVAYESGALTRIDLAAGVAEAPFATLPAQPHGLATAGSIVMAADPSGAWGTHYTFLPSGAGVSTVDWNYYSREYAWSPSAGRMYFFRDDTSPNDLHWESIDTTSGAITGEGESPYHGDFAIAPPIRPSVDGGYVLLGSGDLYDGATLEVVASLPITPSDAAWLPDGTLITLRADAGDTLLEQWTESGETFLLVNHERFSGEPIRVFSRSTTAVVITDMGWQPTFAEYVPTDDGDGDGVPFTDDAFPLDAAASVDTDGDGHPDAWNPGQTQADSATGLVLDAFPLDSACQLPEHGLASDPGVCDIANGIPDYVPDQVMLGSDDVVYLFSRTHDRIFRWSLSADYHLNPIVLGASDALHAAYGAEDHRLYVAYESGALTRIDLAAGVAEAPFATLPAQPHGLATAGSIVMAADPSGAWGTHYTFLPSGTRVSAIDWNYQSPEYAWSAALGRMFYFSHWSPADLHWESIDATSGAITGTGESPYHGDFPIVAPIRPSPDGSHVLLGSGNIYDGTTLNVVHSLPAWIRDAAWLSDGGLVTIRNAPGGTSTLLDHHGDGFALLGSQTIAGAPLRVLATPTETVLLTQGPRGPQFQTVVP